MGSTREAREDLKEKTAENESSRMTAVNDDPGLVRAAQQGDMGAFEELVARHRDKIYARALGIVRNEEEAIDLCQGAWVKGWQRLPQFLGESSFGTWITRIVINLCLDYLRRQRRHPQESIEELVAESGGVERQMPVVTVNPTAGLERAELRQRIDQALSQLSHEHRTVLILHEFEQMGYKDVAKAMGCSIGTVMSRLFYARRKMAALLAGVEKEDLKCWATMDN
jgi:RNA polymerase sigma-70 factor (ECF subfamily)